MDSRTMGITSSDQLEAMVAENKELKYYEAASECKALAKEYRAQLKVFKSKVKEYKNKARAYKRLAKKYEKEAETLVTMGGVTMEEWKKKKIRDFLSRGETDAALIADFLGTSVEYVEEMWDEIKEGWTKNQDDQS